MGPLPADHGQPTPPRRPGKVIPIRPGTKIKRHPVRRVFRFLFRLVVVLVVLSVIATGSLNWVHVDRTSYMHQAGEPIAFRYVSMDHISRFLVASTLVHEDDQLGTRVGAFDWNAFWARAARVQVGACR